MSFTSTIITIGDELLIGQTIDTNSAWIAQALNKIGLSVYQRIAIADDKKEIKDTLSFALNKVNLVIITGGLGPTPDDLTKVSLCEYFNSKLIQDKQVLTHIQHIFKGRADSLLLKNLKQAEVPHNCKVLFNSIGTAPGMWFEKNEKIIISLPGVPYEMQNIMEEEALPLLKQKFNAGSNIYHKTLLMMGIGESILAEKIADIEAGLSPDIKLAYLPSRGFVKLRLSSSGKDKEILAIKVNHEADKIKLRLGRTICAAEEDIPIEKVVAELMKSKLLKLGFAESCTGGDFAHRITNLPGSSQFFNGSIVCYSNAIKESLLNVSDKVLHTVGAVSEATVQQMAEKARILLNTDYTLSVSGILGPMGATNEKPVGMVWMAIASATKTITQLYHFRYDRIGNKEMTVNYGLNWLRLTILEDEKELMF